MRLFFAGGEGFRTQRAVGSGELESTMASVPKRLSYDVAPLRSLGTERDTGGAPAHRRPFLPLLGRVARRYSPDLAVTTGPGAMARREQRDDS